MALHMVQTRSLELVFSMAAASHSLAYSFLVCFVPQLSLLLLSRLHSLLSKQSLVFVFPRKKKSLVERVLDANLHTLERVENGYTLEYGKTFKNARWARVYADYYNWRGRAAVKVGYYKLNKRDDIKG